MAVFWDLGEQGGSGFHNASVALRDLSVPRCLNESQPSTWRMPGRGPCLCTAGCCDRCVSGWGGSRTKYSLNIEVLTLPCCP
eukprot:5604912-Amphidinium_carterae.2